MAVLHEVNKTETGRKTTVLYRNTKQVPVVSILKFFSRTGLPVARTRLVQSTFSKKMSTFL